MIIAIGMQKGGVGKSTTAINLAAAWGEGQSVLIVDSDYSTGTVTKIYKKSRVAVVQADADAIPGVIREHNADVTFIDIGPSRVPEMGVALMEADMAIVPTTVQQDSLSGLWEMYKTLEHAHMLREQSGKHPLDIRLLFTQTDKTSKTVAKIEAASALSDYEVLETRIPYRRGEFEGSKSAWLSLVEHKPESIGSLAYKQLYGEIKHIIEKVHHVEN